MLLKDKGLVYSQRGEKRSQQGVHEIPLATWRLEPIGTSEEDTSETVRMAFLLEVRPIDKPETGGYGKPAEPQPGTTHFEHVADVVQNAHAVWSYCNVEELDIPRGAFKGVHSAAWAIINAVSSGNQRPPLSEERSIVPKGNRDGNETVQTHESFGMARISRHGAGGNGHFFGSQLQHSSSISLTIARASIRRDLSSEWYHQGDDLIEIEMTASQFTEILTTPNMGSGVPVSLRQVMGRSMPDVPPPPTMSELVSHDVQESLNEMERRLDKLTELLKAAAPKLGKKRFQEISDELGIARGRISSSIPFVHEQFMKSCQKTIADAKAEIEATVNIVTQHLGEQVLSGKLPVQLPKAPQLSDTIDIEGEASGGEN